MSRSGVSTVDCKPPADLHLRPDVPAADVSLALTCVFTSSDRKCSRSGSDVPVTLPLLSHVCQLFHFNLFKSKHNKVSFIYVAPSHKSVSEGFTICASTNKPLNMLFIKNMFFVPSCCGCHCNSDHSYEFWE